MEMIRLTLLLCAVARAAGALAYPGEVGDDALLNVEDAFAHGHPVKLPSASGTINANEIWALLIIMSS